MAPITATSTGIIPQRLDDERLRVLLENLKCLPNFTKNVADADQALAPCQQLMQQLVPLLEPLQSWVFEEQVDLHEWIHPLNILDTVIRWSLATYPFLLLVVPIDRRRSSEETLEDSEKDTTVKIAESVEDVQQVPAEIVGQLKILVRFLAGLLRNSTGKGIFASVAELVDLLAAADDELADLALAALQAVAMSPALHKQQAPEVHQHVTAIHDNSKIANSAHARLTSLARGWGTRAMGLGLYTVVTADDSIHQQLPPEAGMVHFGFYLQDVVGDSSSSPTTATLDELSNMIQITITKSEMMKDNNNNNNNTNEPASLLEEVGGEEDADHSSKKRRRVSSLETKSTAELFFLALSKAGGRCKVPADRVFSLLADVRLARSFHSKATRVRAVARRLGALIGILHAHPSPDVMSGYFQAQPELYVEIVDLLRPTVSSANVAASSAAPGTNSAIHRDTISGLAGPQSVPFEIRMLALEALTALVSRREGSGTTRLSSVLTELGVGKGHYLGILPTLIRYSLASFGSLSAASGNLSVAPALNNEAPPQQQQEDDTSGGTLDIGLAFLEATAAPLPPRWIQVERALAFIDNVLTLTSAVVSTSTGTAALTECGLIPALLNTVTVDMDTALENLLPGGTAASCIRDELSRISAMMRFVAAQAVQILEGALVTYGNALTAFHDLHGVEVLTSRLSLEIKSTKGKGSDTPTSSDAVDMDIDTPPSQQDGGAGKMDVDTSEGDCNTRTSQRVLLFSILTCLTVVFHQESAASSTVTTPSGGAQLRKPELTQAVIAILKNITSYGGHLASLVANLLTDVMNSDPHVVHYVHTSGIAAAFLNMIIGEKVSDAEGIFGYRPIVPPVPELIMALPNVLSAFSLTEDGAKAVAKVNPFPSMLRLFYHPNYAMPQSKCLLNEMTAIAGTGLDEIIRHVDRLKPLVLKAISEAISNTVDIAKDLSQREEQALHSLDAMSEERVELENERSCLIQYMLNFGQLMEQILHNEENVIPFVDAGGLDAILKLFPASMPSGLQFLVHVSSMSSPSVSTLHHSTVEESLSLAFKCIDVKYDPLKLIQKMSLEANMHLDRLEECRRKLAADERFVLEKLRDVSLYSDISAETTELAQKTADYLHSVACVEWISSTLATAIRAANRRSEESSTGWGRNEREWKKELASEAFAQLTKRLADFHQESILQVCRIRSQAEFEAKEQQRLLSRSRRLRFRLRIVCPEGAVVRDGTEIDSCASVGSMEMGEIAVAIDRCINSSGILRYRTPRGWISEMTRGHGREPIAEVTSLWEADEDEALEDVASDSKRVECDIPDLRSVGVGVLARAQNSYSELLNALSKVVVQSVRTLETRTISFDPNSQGGYVAATMKHVASAVRSGFDLSGISSATDSESSVLNESGAAMYLGCMIDNLHACLFDERRERRMVNFPLLVNLISYDPVAIRLSGEQDSDSSNSGHVAVSDAIQFVLNHCLSDFSARASTRSQEESVSSAAKRPIQRVGLGVGSSFSPVVKFLRRLMMTPLSSSPVASVMSRIKWKDVPVLIGGKDIKIMFSGSPSTNEYFEPEHFSRGLLLTLSEVVHKVWVDPRFCFAPPFLTFPFTSLAGEIIAGLEDASKKRAPSSNSSSSSSSSRARPGAGTLLSDWIRGRTNQEDTETADNEPFEPSEEAVTSLTEMGFSRDQAFDALERTQSNRVEIAMEYALSHAPPSPATAARRRTEREERARRRQEREQQRQSSNENGGTDASAPVEGAAIPESGHSNHENETNTASSMEVVAAEPEKKEPVTREDEYVTLIVSSLASWIDGAPKVCCKILENVQPSSNGTGSANDSSMPDANASTSNGDGEAEAETVVLCSFLLDLCNRYPEKRTTIITEILDGLKARIFDQAASSRIDQSSEAAVAALCHAVVLFTRALPRTRLLVLQKDLLQPLVLCVRQFVDTEVKQNWSRQTVWPMWLAPVLLLLDIMAQPVVAFPDDEDTNNLMAKTDDAPGELRQVYMEHQAQSKEISELANKIFSTLKADDSTKQAKPATSESTNSQNSEQDKDAPPDLVKDKDSKSPSTDAGKEEKAPFSSVPAYFPLVPNVHVQTCVEICYGLLGCLGDFTGKVAPPPGVTQAALLLLLRLTRTPSVAAQCLRAGVAEAILALPPDCKFTGNTGLITFIFRRLLEDSSTLQCAMETEIRSSLTKLHAKTKMSLAKSERANLPLRHFVEAVTPLLCRDPCTFLRAMAVTVRIEVTGPKESTDSKVFILTPEERAKNLRLLADILPSASESNTSKSDGRKESPYRRRANSTTTPKTKSGHHKAAKRPSTKKSKKDKTDIQRGLSQLLQATGTPSVLVTCLLVDRIMSSSAHAFESEESWFEENSFLWTGDLLEILADLVLAVPACASAVHNYRPHKSKDKATRTLLTAHMNHALSGCPSPPRTFVSFLLHSLLPQDRWSLRGDPDIWERLKENTPSSVSIKAKKKRAFRLTKISQTAARVLVALVARPGEGRKRVIADLSFALSGGRLGHGTWVSDGEKKGDHLPSSDAGEMHALQAWGELCLGLAVPRGSGNNLEGMPSISLENVRLMLENGMAHALLYSLHRVRIVHPMASTAFGTLLLPFEVLTRPNVSTAIKLLREKEESAKTSQDTAKSSGAAALRSEDEDMVDAAFQETILTSASGQVGGANEQHEPQNGAIEFDELVNGDEADSDNGEGGAEAMDVEDAADGAGSDEEGSSVDESDDESSEEDSESEMDEDEEEESELDESEEIPSDEVEDEGDWNVDYGDTPVLGNNADNEFDGDEEDGTDRADQAIDEGWTRVESSGFGGMLLGSGIAGRRNPASAGRGDGSARARGFIDAAEAMIGSLLRTGEISPDTLAEIEGSLGIRIMSGNRSLRTAVGGPDALGGLGDTLVARMIGGPRVQAPDQSRRGEVVGTLPHISQRSQPDAGYASVMGSNGRSVEISSMEYVFGGPSVTAGSRNYDLVSTQVEPPDDDVAPNFSQLDLQLFPGGPAAAASARTQHSLHPLLCGVDLPPVNALVSDLLPHGLRATRQGQMTTRRSGDWTNTSFSAGGYLVSTSTGNIIRATRAQPVGMMSVGLSSRPVNGPVGWTDDGLPFDATVEDLGAAFELALAEAARPDVRSSAAAEGENPGATNTLEAGTNGDVEDAGMVESDAVGQSGGAGEAENPNAEEGEGPGEDSEAAATEHANSDHEDGSPGVASLGDRVASSLAAGLRLSPGNDSEDPMSSESPVARDDVTQAVDLEGTTSQAVQNDVAQSNNVDQSMPDSRRAGSELDDNNESRSRDIGDGVEQPPEGEGAAMDTSPTEDALSCPPDIDPEVFASLPQEMQQDLVDQHNASRELAAQIDGSSLDPEVLAALPEEMRREVIEQERRERRMREQQEEPPADPALAEDMDNASFIASLAPDLRQEILLTADDTFLSSLPPSIVAEAQILRERAAQHRRGFDQGPGGLPTGNGIRDGGAAQRMAMENADGGAVSAKRRQRSGKLRVESDHEDILYLPDHMSPPVAKTDLQLLIRLMYLLSPVRPSRVQQKVFQNMCVNPGLRAVLSSVFVKLLQEDAGGARTAVEAYGNVYAEETDSWRKSMDSIFTDEFDFPPTTLLGTAPEFPDADAFGINMSPSILRRRQGLGTAASAAASLPKSANGSGSDSNLPPVVAARLVDTILQLCKSSARFCLHSLVSPVLEEQSVETKSSCFESLLDLLKRPLFSKSSANLDQLLTVLEATVSPLSHLSKPGDDEMEISQRDIDTAAANGKEWVDVPRVSVSQQRLQLLCSILRMESCRDSAFTKVNTIVRRLCRVESNRGYVLEELASVAHALGADALRDLRALRIRMDQAVAQHKTLFEKNEESTASAEDAKGNAKPGLAAVGTISSSVTLSTSTSELKLLRVLQTLQALCGDSAEDSTTKKNEGSVIVTEELVQLLRQMNFTELWDELSLCLKTVQVLEGVTGADDADEKGSDEADAHDDASGEENGQPKKKLRNSAAGLLARFLPSVEAFFVSNASATRPKAKQGEDSQNELEELSLDNLVGGKRFMDFVSTNKVLLNALVRNNPALLDKGLRALVQVPRCRVFLDFDVKRQWFKTQVRRLRQHASRRHGSLRLHIRRKYVFEDAYHQLRLRNADEMRGRLHITFRNEEGVDAGGLSREFFGILGKEIFNPNYALFTSTEDGCTFQPNPNSNINPDHLSYFRFVGRIVGKAVADGYLLDAHFTRSLYKHMLGMQPTHHDMEAIDPDYYRNLQTILNFNLEDIGLDLTFSIDDHSFGRSHVIDLIPNGRSVAVTEENKEEYVRLVCQNRMTTAIQNQIKAYLDGFYEMVNPELIAIFTPRELELLISGLPDIDMHDLKKNTDYVGYRQTDREIGWFWNILFSLSRNEKAAFLQFVTGSSKVPLTGFSDLQGMRGIQKFSIHKVAAGSKGALMSAHTCFNSLDLPVYQSEEEMRQKLLYAINEGGGAFLFA